MTKYQVLAAYERVITMIINIIEISGLLAGIAVFITYYFSLKKALKGEDVSLKKNLSILLLFSYVFSVAIISYIIKFLKAFQVNFFIEDWKTVSLVVLTIVANLLIFTKNDFMEILSQETGTTAKRAYKLLVKLMKYFNILIVLIIILLILVIIK